jgi:hypothetical protein
MMRVLTQDMVNYGNKDIPPGMQQVLDDHSRIVQMMSQMVASTNNSLPQNDHGGKEPRGDVEMTLQACKRCGEIGHTFKECHEQCPYCDASHPIGECPMTQVTCFLCEGINHVPTECKFYPMVQRVNQQAKDGLSQLLGKTPENRRTKMKVEDKIMRTTHNFTTKCFFSCEEEGHLSRDCLKKRKRFPTITLEFEENEVRDLSALEIPKKKKKKKLKEKDSSKTLCWNCRKLGHYSKEYPEPNMQRGTNLVTYQKCNQKGHYARRCEEKSTSRLQKMG